MLSGWYDFYKYETPFYDLFLGKIHSQTCRSYRHSAGYGKWTWQANPGNIWYYFNKGLRKQPPASEPLVDINDWYSKNAINQIWALGQNGHLFHVGYNANGCGSVSTDLNAVNTEGTQQEYTEYFNQCYSADDPISNVVKLVPLARAFIKQDGTLWEQNSAMTEGKGYYEFHQTDGINGLYKVTTNSSRSAYYALKQDGTVWVRGAVANVNTDSLGLGATTATPKDANDAYTWVQIPGLSNIKEIHTANYTYGSAKNENFAINTNGQVWAWGYDAAGNLANGTVGALVTQPTACSKVNAISGGIKQIVTLSGNCTLFLDNNGKVYYVGDYSADSTDTISNTENPIAINEGTGSDPLVNIKNIYFESRCFCAWLVTNNGYVYTVEAQTKTLNDLHDIRLLANWNFCVDLPTNTSGSYSANNNNIYYQQLCTYDTSNANVKNAKTVKVICTTNIGTTNKYGTLYDEKTFEFTENGTYKMAEAKQILEDYKTEILNSLRDCVDLVTTTNTGTESTNVAAKAYYKITYTPKFVAGEGFSIDYSMVWGLNDNYGVDVDSGNYVLDYNGITNIQTNLLADNVNGSITKTLIDTFKNDTIGFLKVLPLSTYNENYTSSITGLTYKLTTTYSQGDVTVSSNTISWTTTWAPSGSSASSFTYGTSSNAQFTSANYTNASTVLTDGGTTQRTALKSYLDTLIGDVALPAENPKVSQVTTNGGRVLYLRTTYTKV